MMKNIGILLVIFLVSIAGFAQKSPADYGMDTTQTLPVGLEVGSKAPKFKTTDIDGNAIVMKDLLKQGPVVIIFYRGEWCPVCNRYLAELNNSLPEIKEKGATVLVISPEMKVHVQKTKENSSSDFVFVSDPGSKICESYDVLFTVTEAYQKKINTKFDKDIAEFNGQDVAKLPVPATYVINQEGEIVYKQFEYNYRNRASGSDILEAL